MTIEQFGTTLIRRWKLIIACFLLVGLGAFGGSKLMHPLYQSSTIVLVFINDSGNTSTYDNLLASEQLVQTDSDMATSTPVLHIVASHYPGLTEGDLVSEVSSSVKTGTQLFEIDVLDPSPTRAADLANDVANTLIEQQLQITQQQNTQAQQSLQQNMSQTKQQIDQITAQIASLRGKNGDQGQISLLQTQLTALQQQYSQWQLALAQLELAQAQSRSSLQVVQSAQPALRPVRPNVLLYTAGGLLVGLLLGILLALLADRLDTRVRTADELAKLLAWPMLATVWRDNPVRAQELIGPTGRDANVEAYRILRTNIGFSSVDQPLRSLTVTSALPGEGKSTIAANLAIFMARAGKNTLLIDADLRRPSQHVLFDLSPEKLGLSNAVLSLNTPKVPKTSFQDAQKTPPPDEGDPYTLLEPFVHSVGVPNLWVMPSGPLPPNPSEFLESQSMKRFLAIVANCGVDMLIIDAPPIVGLSDTSILVSKFDGVLVVVDTMQATQEKLKRMKATLTQSGVRVLGCVVNKVRRTRKDAVDYYYSPEPESREKTPKRVQLPPAPVTPPPVPPEGAKSYSN